MSTRQPGHAGATSNRLQDGEMWVRIGGSKQSSKSRSEILRHSNLLLLLCFVLFAITLWGQQDDAPLGDVARKARQTKSSQPHAKVTVTSEDSAASGEAGKLDLDLCSLLTTSEAEEALGGPLTFPPRAVSYDSGAKTCSYTTAKSRISCG